MSLRIRLGMTVAMAVIGGAAPAAEKRQNVLVVLTDDQRFDTIHALGNDEIRTPTQDALVARGFHFNNAYCMGSLVPAVCAPSRTMFMTGKSLFRVPAPNVPYAGPTLGSAFRDAGYATLFVGKRGNTFRAGNEAFETVVYHSEKDFAKHASEASFMADRAIGWLNDRPTDDDRPFLIYLGPPVPHDPRVAPPEYMNAYDPERITLSPNYRLEHPFDNGEWRIRDELLAPFPRTEPDMKRHLADYYATITWLDHNVGRVIEALKSSGLLEKTVIVFSSDQGLAVGGRHGLMGKQNLYEEFKSPLVFAGPGVPKGSSDALVYLHDVLPTLCDLAGITRAEEFEGKSLAPVVRGESSKVRDTLFGAYKGVQRMVRDDRWKLIWYTKIDRFQLFDLSSDPWEIDDLSANPRHAGRMKSMKRLMAAEQDSLGDGEAPRPAL